MALAFLLTNGFGDSSIRAEPEGLELVFSDPFESGTSCGWSSISFPGHCRYDFWCAGDTTPTTAADPLSLSGTLTDFDTAAPIPGASVEGRRTSDNSLLDSDTTVQNGSFELVVPTGGLPLSAYVRFAAATYPATGLYPADPLVADVIDLDGRMILTSRMAFFYVLAGTSGPEAGKGTALIQVVDCAGTPILGALLQLNPAPGVVRYMSGGVPNAGATSTDATGIAMGFNAPSGPTTVGATLGGRTLESHGFSIVNQELSLSVVHP